MNLIYKIFIFIIFSITVFGSIGLIYMQTIDGTLINPPFTFQPGIDPQNFKTDKATYHRGEMVSILTSVCKNRDYTADVTWKLINETVITFPTSPTKINSPGCLINKYIPIGEIPMYAVLGPHHLEGTSAVKVNPFHILYFNFRSQDFNVE